MRKLRSNRSPWPPSRLTRRQFMQRAGLATVGISAASPMGKRAARAVANDRIVLGFIGFGGMGRSHFDRLLRHPEVQVAAVADPDGEATAMLERPMRAPWRLPG